MCSNVYQKVMNLPQQHKKKQTQQLLVSAPPNNEALSTRTAKALGTYASTYNQIPQQQIASTITGIDFYV